MEEEKIQLKENDLYVLNFHLEPKTSLGQFTTNKSVLEKPFKDLKPLQYYGADYLVKKVEDYVINVINTKKEINNKL